MIKVKKTKQIKVNVFYGEKNLKDCMRKVIERRDK